MSEAIQNDLGRTPLHMAALADDRKLAAALIEAGADVNAQDKQGNTPMSVALGLDRAEKTMDMDKSLFWISQGANPSITNEDGACVWWKSTPAAQNNMVSEMWDRDRKLEAQAAAGAWSPDPAEAGRKFDQAFKEASSQTDGTRLRQSRGLRQ